MIYLKEGEKHPNQTKVTKEVLKKRNKTKKELKFKEATNSLTKTDSFKPVNGIVVDASVRKKDNKNPIGSGEIRGVDIETGKIVFNKKISWAIESNLAEYLAIYIGFLYLDNLGKELVIYSDNTNAISWIKNGKCKTNMHSTDIKQQHNILKAERRTKEDWGNIKAVRFWNKKEWGENPADFGRKRNN
jgi:ribonuclease HI